MYPCGPQSKTELYPSTLQHDASPKAISRRTSYLQVRLAFHLQPQVIRALCNTLRFGPPRSFTCASACPWLGHLVSGLIATTNFALFRLAFTAPPVNTLSLPYTINSLDRSTKSTPSPGFPCGRPGSDSLYAHNFRFYFTPLPGYF